VKCYYTRAQDCVSSPLPAHVKEWAKQWAWDKKEDQDIRLVSAAETTGLAEIDERWFWKIDCEPIRGFLFDRGQVCTYCRFYDPNLCSDPFKLSITTLITRDCQHESPQDCIHGEKIPPGVWKHGDNLVLSVGGETVGSIETHESTIAI